MFDSKFKNCWPKKKNPTAHDLISIPAVLHKNTIYDYLSYATV